MNKKLGREELVKSTIAEHEHEHVWNHDEAILCEETLVIGY